MHCGALLMNMLCDLQLRLEDAVESEDFTEASRLKLLIAERMAYDTAGEFMNQLTVRDFNNFRFELFVLSK